MKVTIQSKSGDLNAELEFGEVADNDLKNALIYLRSAGGYHAFYKKDLVFVPFEEIWFIQETKE
jgi:hypothetical protein